jgi:hypothetical protein
MSLKYRTIVVLLSVAIVASATLLTRIAFANSNQDAPMASSYADSPIGAAKRNFD